MKPDPAVWVMPVGGLDEAAISPLAQVLDDGERDRAARFVFERNRVEYIAAHALARRVLAAATGYPPEAFRFETGEHGKPVARAGDAWAGLHFNLSHTNGLVGVAVAPFDVGLDLESIDRRTPLDIASHYFCPPEIAWLKDLPEARRCEGFLRLWTLKEAFIKATGLGLSQPLDTFWFEVCPPSIRFEAAIADDPSAWRFEQRVIDGAFLGAVGFRLPTGPAPVVGWWRVEPGQFAAAAGASLPVERLAV